SRFVVPGIGAIQGFCARSQASATCADVAFFRAAMVASRSTSARFAFRFSGSKRGTVLRKSPVSNRVFSSIVPVRNPLPSGLEGRRSTRRPPGGRRPPRRRPPPPGGFFPLRRREGLGGVGPAIRPHAGLGQTEVPALPPPDQIPPRARHVLDGNLRIHAV